MAPRNRISSKRYGSFLSLLLCVEVHVGGVDALSKVYAWKPEDSLCVLVLFPVWAPVNISGWQAWRQVPLPTEPSCCPCTVFLRETIS